MIPWTRFFLAFFLLSCGAQFQQLTPAQKADVAINAAAQGLHVTDTGADTMLQSCIANETAAQPQTCGRRFAAVAHSELAAYSALTTLQHLVNAQTLDLCAIVQAINGAVAAMQDVAAAVTDLGGAVSVDFTRALPQLSSLTSLFPCQVNR